MAKKKQPKKQQASLSPEKYIITKARNLPIEKCIINSDWQNAGEASIIVARQHKSGNRTLGVFLVDVFCLGVKDAFYLFNQDNIEFENIEERFGESFETKEISYTEAHNIIYGAISYAGEIGFEPADGFGIAKYILEEDTEDIPLIEYDFGKDGKPLLIVHTQLEASKYLPVLVKNVGIGNFEYVIRFGNNEEVDTNKLYEDDDDDEFEDFDDEHNDDLFGLNYNIVSTKYDYQYPEYPTELTYKHRELDVFFDPKNNLKLDRSTIDSILAIDRDELLTDLENIVLYEIGRTYNMPQELWNEPDTSVLAHAMLFLGELRATEKLNVVIEILRQSEEFSDFHFGDFTEDILPLTIYYLARNQTERLMEFMKEPSLYPYLRIHVPGAMCFIAVNEPQRREEVIEWFRSLLNLYLEDVNNCGIYDSTLAGLIMNELIELKATELLPEIKALYDTETVDFYCCGGYEEVEGEMAMDSRLKQYELKDIYKRYEELRINFN